MNPSREEALFALALEKPAEKRAAFLNAICEGDAALRLRLDTLLAPHEAPVRSAPRHGPCRSHPPELLAKLVDHPNIAKLSM